MHDIQVDENGDFRCSNCGGKQFTAKRTRRAKIIGVTAGVATVGLVGAAAPLVATKKLYCQGCGTYNRMGNAQPYAPTVQPVPPSKAKPVEPELDPLIARRIRPPVKKRDIPKDPGSSRAGQYLTVKKPLRPGHGQDGGQPSTMSD